MIEVHIRHGQASAEVGWGLTEEGKSQAKAAAAYLQSHFPQVFFMGVHSGSRRAAETAQLLGIPGVEWTQDARLREGNWNGGMVPRNFDLWREMYGRVSAFCKEWDAHRGDRNRIIVSHGGTMQMVRAYREGFTGSRFETLFHAPYKYFTNCQILIYTDQNPRSQAIDPATVWVKSVCPWDASRFGHDWVAIVQ